MFRQLIFGRFLHDTHLGGNFDTSKRAVTCKVARLDIDGVHIVVLVVVLAEELCVSCLAASCGHVCHGRSVGGVAVVAGCREELGEDAANDWSQEREAGADDCDIALCCCPVGGSHVAVCFVC